jgi:hypothetical protein
MIHALRQKVIVQPGGVIEIRSDELPPGATADVIVILDSAPAQALPLVRLIGAGKGSFATPAEADAFLRDERDAWES